MTHDLNMIERTFNELTIKEFIPKPNTDKYKSWNTSTWVKCKCSCGESVEAPLYGIQKGFIKSCGHLRKEQAATNLSENRDSTHNAIFLTHDGKTMNLSEWSQETGIPRTTIMYRLSKELPVERVLERKNKNDTAI